jgi:hypothetical protein
MVDYGHGWPKGSLVLDLAAAPMHGGSSAMEQWREERVGSPSRASSGRGRRCGDRATAVVALGAGGAWAREEERKREEVRWMTTGLSPFIGAEGGGQRLRQRNG